MEMALRPIGERSFVPEPRSARDARRFVRGLIEGFAVDADVIELLSSELATNAVLHAHTTFAVRVCSGGAAMRVEVANHEPELLPIVGHAQRGGEGGRGLAVMQAFASRWGLEFSRDEKVVWFELPLTNAPPRSESVTFNDGLNP